MTKVQNIVLGKDMHIEKNNEDLSSSAHFTQVMAMNFICVKGSNPKFNAQKDSMQTKM